MKPIRRKDGRFQVWVRIKPGPNGRKSIIKATPEEALSCARELLQEFESIRVHQGSFLKGSFAEFVYNVYVPHVYPHIRESTKRTYDSLLVLHILPALGHLQIAEIGYQEMKRMLDNLLTLDRKTKAKKPLQARRKNEVVMHTRQILNLYNQLAQAKGERTRDDWKLVKPPAKKRKKARIELPDDFVPKFVEAAKGTYLIGPALAAMLLGLRRGEVCGLLKSKVQQVEGGYRVTIDKQLTRESLEVPVDTKGASRSFEIPASVWKIISPHADKGKSAFVFTNKGRPLIVDEVSKLTAKVCAKAQLPSIDFHDLRAFAASSLIGLGVDPFTVMEILGHTDLRTTSIYIDARSAQKKAALLRLAESLKMVDEGGS